LTGYRNLSAEPATTEQRPRKTLQPAVTPVFRGPAHARAYREAVQRCGPPGESETFLAYVARIAAEAARILEGLG
jgi:hypothetical protein